MITPWGPWGTEWPPKGKRGGWNSDFDSYHLEIPRFLSEPLPSHQWGYSEVLQAVSSQDYIGRWQLSCDFQCWEVHRKNSGSSWRPHNSQGYPHTFIRQNPLKYSETEKRYQLLPSHRPKYECHLIKLVCLTLAYLKSGHLKLDPKWNKHPYGINDVPVLVPKCVPYSNTPKTYYYFHLWQESQSTEKPHPHQANLEL